VSEKRTLRVPLLTKKEAGIKKFSHHPVPCSQYWSVFMSVSLPLVIFLI
jgi:hypothetical protein